jgi:adenylate kinase family enzyme
MKAEHGPRLLVLGAAGCGQTTLGRALASALNIAHLETESFYWLPTSPPYGQKRPRSERRNLLGLALSKYPSWVLSGTISGWGDRFIPMISAVIFLTVPAPVRIKRLQERQANTFGLVAISPGGSMYERHMRFIEWASAYDLNESQNFRSRMQHEIWLRRLKCPVIRLDGLATTKEMTKDALQRLCLCVNA